MSALLVRLIDDDDDLRQALATALRLEGFAPEVFASAEAALVGLTPEYSGVILSDVRMPKMDGIALQRHLHALDPELPVILLTGHGDVEMAVSALKSGAYDFLLKPAGRAELSASLRRALATRALVLENRLLRAAPALHAQIPELTGNSPAARHLRDSVARLGPAPVDLMLQGPIGVGHEAIARALHGQSLRAARPFIRLICSALTAESFEAELLGQIPARGPRLQGALERAHRGTLFLDGIDDLAPPLQARLFALLDAPDILPIGAGHPRPFDLRLISASTRDLRAAEFRAELFYRLSGVSLTLPALRDRREDIPEIFRLYLIEAARAASLAPPPVTAALQARLAAHDFEGNLRELQNVAQNHLLGAPDPRQDSAPTALKAQLDEVEATLIRSALQATKGSATQAMARLEIARKTFYDKCAKHGIDPAEFRSKG